jgi:ubiquinone/menaquinone biosynthesis C-methylase UbiE
MTKKKIGYHMVLNAKTAEEFKQYMQKYPKLYQNLAHITKEYIPSTVKQPTIIDIGMGIGLLISELSTMIPTGHFIGIDSSKDMIAAAHKYTAEKQIQQLKIMVASAEQLPLTTASVDIAVSRFSLPYWENPDKAFSEIHRVLKPGGKLILEALNKEYPQWKLRLIKLHMWFNHAAKSVISYHSSAYDSCYTLQEVHRFLTAAHLTVIRSEGRKHDWKFLVVAEKG